VLLGDTDGPTLFGQGQSLQEGPLQVEWRADDGTTIAVGTSCDVRVPGEGARTISAYVADSTGLASTTLVGRYDNTTGRALPPARGL
jgi:hypothetical protein